MPSSLSEYGGEDNKSMSEKKRPVWAALPRVQSEEGLGRANDSALLVDCDCA